MRLQGNLQQLFEALYNLGVIDPVLDKDWNVIMEKIEKDEARLAHIVRAANQSQGSVAQLMTTLRDFDAKSLEYLALEVAKEYADFYTKDALH